MYSLFLVVVCFSVGVVLAGPVLNVKQVGLAELGDIPYQISVWDVWELSNITHISFSCAGVLVDPEYVLTTRTCVEVSERGSLKVLAAGGHLIGEDDPGNDYHEMVGSIKHPGYDTWTGVNDIALMKVSPRFVTSDNIKIIPLRQVAAALETQCTVSGWDLDYFETSDVLAFDDDVRYLNKSECRMGFSTEEELWGMQICAGIPKSEGSVCNVGDEGGPLVCEGQLTGLVMDADVTVCISGEPRIYLDVVPFHDWIIESIATGPTTTESTTATSTPSTAAATTTKTPSTTTTAPTTTPNPNVAVELGDLKYQVSIWNVYEWDNANKTYFECAGTLVDPEYVVTTWRCADQISRSVSGVLVAAGHLSKKDTTDVDFHNVEEVIKHEDYDWSSRINDIAVLKVSPKFATTANIAPISVRTTPIALNAPCTISGWKINYFDESDVLLSSSVSNLNKTNCKYLYEDEPDIYKTKLCAGVAKGEPGEKCNVGDEGGPLVCGGQLTGIYSDFAVVCTTSQPAIYLDVAYFSDWILSKISPLATQLPTTVHTTGEIDNGPGGASSLHGTSITILLFLALTIRLYTRL